MQISKDIWVSEDLVRILKQGGIAVMPTDTIYGVVGRAENRQTVERIYQVRKRNPDKPFIVLIGDISELDKFSINLTDAQKEKLKEYWSFESSQDKPKPTSIILDCTDTKFDYLHRGTEALAFRLPDSDELRKLLLETGALVAPSANPEGSLPAQNIIEAEAYFGDLVDFYLDGGTISGKASKLIKLHKDGSISILRE